MYPKIDLTQSKKVEDVIIMLNWIHLDVGLTSQLLKGNVRRVNPVSGTKQWTVTFEPCALTISIDICGQWHGPRAKTSKNLYNRILYFNKLNYY